jgi:1-acyl-sn-glycerol-3-phosphate acyltransferase
MQEDPLAPLSAVERRRYRLADALVRYVPWLSIAWNSVFMVNVVRLLGMRRLNVRGLEHLAALGPDARVILVANHRSFFDFYMVGALLYTRTRLPKRVLFPVRSTFFYDHAFGSIVNGVMSAFTMFPPILRDAGGARQRFNRFALDRCIEHLSEPGRMLGVHPEGKRNPNEDPYTLLRPQPGTGRIALATPGVVVIPIWVLGLTNSIATEAKRNWLAPDEFPIDVAFGPPVAFEDLRDHPDAAAAITERFMDAVAQLGAENRARRAPVRRAS